MSRAGDAALAAGVLAVVLAAAVVVDVVASPGAFVLGALGALGLELLLAARAATVRAVWARPGVRALSVAVGVLAVVVAAAVAPELGLNALAGGLVAYLVVLAVVASGALPPSTAWFGRG